MSRRASLQYSTLYVTPRNSQSSLRSLSNEPMMVQFLPPPIPPRPRSSPHRSSQPTLLLHAEYPHLPPPLRPCPSQPLILYNPARRASGFLRSPPQSPLNLTPTNNHHYITHSNPNLKTSSPVGVRKIPKASEKRILKRCHQSDLPARFAQFQARQQNGLDSNPSNESTPSKEIGGRELFF